MDYYLLLIGIFLIIGAIYYMLNEFYKKEARKKKFIMIIWYVFILYIGFYDLFKSLGINVFNHLF